MASTPSGTVKETGAGAGAVLIGVLPLNRNLRIRVHPAQRAEEGRRVEGSFELLYAGDGTYAGALKELLGQDFISTAEFTAELRSKPGAEKCSHVVNRNTLKLWNDADEKWR